ncbi:MAG TPA: NADH-quinone oxidoreductase subunit C [Candidatus Acidoferrales bacterium]|nr:NADH-quinone oxidoreductase subunit C [Candidatus Acidoferrales bacterium]
MLSENLKQNPIATAVEAFDGDAVKAGKLDRGELTLEIAPGKIASICGFLKYDQHFSRISTVTAVDWFPAEPRFEVVYHLHSVERNQRVRLKCRLHGEDPVIESVTPVWRGADWYERETFDLFGIRFLNHPNLRRIMLPDDWEGYPLRKDYPVTGSRV